MITRSKWTKNLQTHFWSTLSVKASGKTCFSQLSSHLSTHNLLSIHQSAYWCGHSTVTILLCILNDLLTSGSSADDNFLGILLLLDLSAAFESFDTTDHGIPLFHLKHDFNRHGAALNWFWSYLSDRKHYLLIEDQKSTETSMDFGVP